ncbi:MAG TPA: hypothetical protein VFK57_05760 [Vicinamibacterales bacterium]|nr:hypothetical protein [Vicinamibacterales bacterium]
MTTRAAGNVVEAVGQVMNLIPDNTTGVAGIASTPVSVSQMPIGTKLAHAFAAAARILYTVADINGTQAGLSLTEGGWDRREADWIFQVTVLDIEIEQIERQVLGAERRRHAAPGELERRVVPASRRGTAVLRLAAGLLRRVAALQGGGPGRRSGATARGRSRCA